MYATFSLYTIAAYTFAAFHHNKCKLDLWSMIDGMLDIRAGMCNVFASKGEDAGVPDEKNCQFLQQNVWNR